MPRKNERLRAYSEEMLRASYASLFWAIITERRKKAGGFTLQSLADELNIDKSGVSRWFAGDAPNWELNTVADIADALGVDLQPPVAIDRQTGVVYTASGIQSGSRAATDATSTEGPASTKIVSSAGGRARRG
jgi:hypothetical protein